MSIKHFVRDSWLTASYYTGLSHLYQALAGQKRGILSYHNVLPVAKLPTFDTYNVDVSEAVFEKQLTFLKKHFRLLPIQELENPKAAGLFLTVDDGMRNNYEIIAPMLEHHGLTALFAVCPAMIDGQLPHIWRDHLFLLLHQAQGQEVFLPMNQYEKPYLITADVPSPEILESVDASAQHPKRKNSSGFEINALTRRLKRYVYERQISDVYSLVREICEKNGWPYASIDYDPLRYQFMNRTQIQELSKRGHRLASHTMTHRILRFLSEEEKEYELVESKKRLESQLDNAVDVLVYPYGSRAEVDKAAIRAAAEAGYQTGLMNIRRHSLTPADLTQPRFALPPVVDAAHLHTIVSGYKFLFR